MLPLKGCSTQLSGGFKPFLIKRADTAASLGISMGLWRRKRRIGATSRQKLQSSSSGGVH